MPFRIRVFLSILLALLILLLVGPLILPVASLPDTAPAGDLALADSRFREVAGVEIHFREAGEGDKAFLLIHGYPGNSLAWRDLMSELSLYGRVVAFDLPGLGLSERPKPGEWDRGANPYALDAQVDQAIGLLDSLAIEEAVLIGASSGALVALEAARQYPLRVEALVLVGAPVYAERSPPPLLRPLLSTPQLNRIGPVLMRQLGGQAGAQLYASQWANPEAIDGRDFEDFRLTFRVDDWDVGLWQLTRASRPSGLSQGLAEIEQPALVVAGSEDQIVPSEDAQRLAAEISSSTLALMDGCGHVVHEECPAQLAEVVLDWLR